MKCVNSAKKIFAVVFAAIVLFTVSVQETHYLFTEHHSQHEHCENHLHKNDGHAHCAVCKFNVSLFADSILPHQHNQPGLITQIPLVFYQSVISYAEVSANPLRGPPAIS